MPQSLSAAPLIAWYRAEHRDLPWRRTRDPYAIWISEIMLQQTRVETVKGYYARFLALFPTVRALADAPEADVLKAWEGLGYYSRARNLQKAAKTIVYELDGRFPSRYDELLTLSGIGEYTAGAIASIAFDEPVPAVDGNVIRVISRVVGVREDVGAPSVKRRIREETAALIPSGQAATFTQAMMELGATVCTPTSPRCDACPMQPQCSAFEEGDAPLLPIHEKKAPAKVVPVAVCLLTLGNRVLVVRRQQRMLHGLYVFNLLEDVDDDAEALRLLEEQGLRVSFGEELGTARHVFTHRVWDMRLLHFQLLQAPDASALSALQAKLVTLCELNALAMPTAVKTARACAEALLQSSETK